MDRRSILVTGGAGFIGSNIAYHLARGGHAVTICDRFGETDKWRNVAEAELVGIVPPEDLPALLGRQRFDAIVHMGAISATTERDVDLIVRTNIELSLLLWDYCSTHETRFIYASSAATYGDGAGGFDDDYRSEALAKLRPLNAYGWSKSLFDRMVVGRIERGDVHPPQWAGFEILQRLRPERGPQRAIWRASR